MKIIAIEKEKSKLSSADFAPHLEAEARAVHRLQKQDFIREIYFRADRNEAVLVLECGSIEEARQGLANLPLVSNGLIEFELIPLKPYPGFERLFKSEL